MDIQARMTDFAMLGATWVMWLLIGLSMVALAIAVERAIYLWRTSDNIQRLRDDLRGYLDRRDVEGARKRLARSKSFEARVIEAGLEAVEDGADSAEERMAGASTRARLSMEKGLAFLGTVGNNAPFVGLLGTVIGIIRAFAELEASSGQVSSGLMAEVGEALVATAIGLLVALPAVAFFNGFHRVIKVRLANADSIGRPLLAVLKSEQPAIVPVEG